MKNKIIIRCGHCQGTGLVGLTGVWADTYRFLERQKEKLSGVALAKLAGVNATAMCNRLAALERLGLAAREHYGRQSKWWAVK